MEPVLPRDPLRAAADWPGGTADGRETREGEGKLGGIIFLALVAALALAAWNVAPVYLEHYDFEDKVNEICRDARSTRRRATRSIMEMLMKEVASAGIDQWIGPEQLHDLDHRHQPPDPPVLRARGRGPAGLEEDLQVRDPADQPLI